MLRETSQRLLPTKNVNLADSVYRCWRKKSTRWTNAKAYTVRAIVNRSVTAYRNSTAARTCGVRFVTRIEMLWIDKFQLSYLANYNWRNEPVQASVASNCLSSTIYISQSLTSFSWDLSVAGFRKVQQGRVLYTVFQKKTSTHIIGYKLRNSCLILIIFDIKIPHIIWHRTTA